MALFGWPLSAGLETGWSSYGWAGRWLELLRLPTLGLPAVRLDRLDWASQRLMAIRTG